MSLIDLASMVLAPTAVKDGKVYNAIPNDQDFTFSRGTEATRVNSAGLIEKARTNLLLQSNQFDTTWTQTNVSVTGGQTGYDGSSDAWLVDISASFAQVEQNISTSGVITYSVYAKAGTLGFVRLRLDASTNAYADFDLSSGTAGTTSGIITTSSTSLADGWYRLTLVTNASSATKARIYPIQADNDLTATSGNILIQDAQLEAGLVATDYIPTTTSSVTLGITDDLPRVDYSGGGCPSLLLEPSRTNEVQYSEYFGASNWSTYSYGGASLATDFGYESPEGKNNAYKFSYTAGSGGNGILFTDNFTATASVDYTLSVWMKGAVGGEKVRLCLMDTGSNGVIGSTFTLTNEWVLYTDTITNSAGTNRGFQFRIQDVIGVEDDQVVYVYGAQAEQGSYVSSYIPTYGTSTSRSADTCSLTNASNLIGQTEGTLFVEYDSNITEDDSFFMVADDGTANNRIVLYSNVPNNLALVINTGGVLQVVIANIPLASGTNKFAVGYANNDVVLYLNGTQVGSDNTASIPSTSALRMSTDNAGADVASGKGTKQAIVFPTRLTNDQLAELTK